MEREVYMRRFGSGHADLELCNFSSHQPESAYGRGE